jgi:D-3-phosphoglycerate dehydrogenase
MTEAVDPDTWRSHRDRLEAERQLDEMTLGILGLGRIGKRIAAVGAAFGMKVIYNDLLDIPSSQRSGARPVDRITLLRESDVLTIHVDGRPTNKGLIDAAELALMQAHVTLINTARGFVVDPAALAHFLRNNPLAQARLDVHQPEPFGPDYPLLDLPNAHLSPHIAGRTRSAMARMSDVVHDVWQVLQGQQPEYPVVPEP